MNTFTQMVVTVQILRQLGTANDLVYHASPRQLKEMCESISTMNVSGCRFTDDQVDLIVDGEESEVEALFSVYDGWPRLNQLLMDIYEQVDDLSVGDEQGLCRAQLRSN